MAFIYLGYQPQDQNCPDLVPLLSDLSVGMNSQKLHSQMKSY